MKAHLVAHRKKEDLTAIGPSASPLWAECTLQTYFVENGRIDCFLVVNNKNDDSSGGPTLLTKPQKTYLGEIEKDSEEGRKGRYH
jgi:hypothetical protein